MVGSVAGSIALAPDGPATGGLVGQDILARPRPISSRASRTPRRNAVPEASGVPMKVALNTTRPLRGIDPYTRGYEDGAESGA